METEEKTAEAKEKKPRAKKQATSKPQDSAVFTEKDDNNEAALKAKRIRLLGGVALLLLASYLFISFFSFIFTWNADQDKIVDGYWKLLSNTEIKVDNWLGKTGAILSHWFIHRGFGLASFLFTPILFALGMKLVFKIKLFSFRKTLKHSFFLLILISITTSFIIKLLGSDWLFIGGNVGYQINVWLSSLIGTIGAALLIIAAISCYIYLGFDWSNVKKFGSDEEAILTENNQVENLPEVIIPVVAQKKSRNWNELNEDEEPRLSQTLGKTIANEIAPVSLDSDKENDEELNTQEFEITNAALKSISKKDTELELIVESVPEVNSVLNITDEGTDDEVVLPHAAGDYDPKADLSTYRYPEIDLLEKHGNDTITINNEELQANKDRILDTLKNYNIEIEKIKATIGPTVTLYEIVPAPGVRISKIKNLEDDIALSLSALGIRIIAPMPGKGTIGIEVPNQKPEIVSMRSIIASEKFQNTTFDLPIALGKTITNDTFIADLAKMPHLLMAGATGQGKSVGLNAILVSLLYKKHPSQIKFVLVDPKKVELTLFNTIERHFLAKLPNAEESIITDTKKVIHTLNSLCILMDARYELLKNAMVRNIKEYNAKFISRRLNPLEGHHYMPYIVLVVDEFADLIMTAGKEVEMPIARLAQLARAIGIHLIIATQRPSVNIITGTIKANFPARIAFRVSSKIDSRTILDAGGAEQLIGRGDMLLSTGNDLIRIQCAFVDTPEVDKITEFIGGQRAYPQPYLLPEYVDENESSEKDSIDLSQRDSFFEEAARIIVQHQQGSTSLIQRRLKLGYNRAGRIVDQLEAAGIIGPFEGSKARQVLIKDEQSLEQILKSL